MVSRNILRTSRLNGFNSWGFVFTICLCLSMNQVPNLNAQTCWIYVDGGDDGTTFTEVPIECVEIGDLTSACSWDEDCYDDGNDSDCCTAIPASGDQTVREMHVRWHNCFGNVGADDAQNPPQRGQRWYAFHRQMESDFNVWRDLVGFQAIESVDWCPDMELPHGHYGGRTDCDSDSDCLSGWDCNGGLCYEECTTTADCGRPWETCSGGRCEHPDGCGDGAHRPDDTVCESCIAFPQCLFYSGAGPSDCPSAPCEFCGVAFCDGTFDYCCPTAATTGCSAGVACVEEFDYGHDDLSEFANVEEIANVLDSYMHGQMHGAVGHSDGTGHFVDDVGDPNCSVRDPMFWRLHKALDDIVRAWQDRVAVDIIIIIDESGSMSAIDGGGSQSKLDAAIHAAKNH